VSFSVRPSPVEAPSKTRPPPFPSQPAAFHSQAAPFPTRTAASMGWPGRSPDRNRGFHGNRQGSPANPAAFRSRQPHSTSPSLPFLGQPFRFRTASGGSPLRTAGSPAHLGSLPPPTDRMYARPARHEGGRSGFPGRHPRFPTRPASSSGAHPASWGGEGRVRCRRADEAGGLRWFRGLPASSLRSTRLTRPIFPRSVSYREVMTLRADVDVAHRSRDLPSELERVRTGEELTVLERGIVPARIMPPENAGAHGRAGLQAPRVRPRGDMFRRRTINRIANQGLCRASHLVTS